MFYNTYWNNWIITNEYNVTNAESNVAAHAYFVPFVGNNGIAADVVNGYWYYGSANTNGNSNGEYLGSIISIL